MAGFYNPLSPNIQWGQGISDLNSQIQQLMLLKQMFTPSQKQTQAQPDTTMSPDVLSSMLGAYMMAGGLGQNKAFLPFQQYGVNSPFSLGQNSQMGSMFGGNTGQPW